MPRKKYVYYLYLLLNHEQISEYAPRQPASVAAQASPLEDPQKSSIHIDALSDKDKGK